MPTIEETIAFIKQAFAEKTDEGGEPYYLHPIAVMNSLPVALKPIDDEVKLAALLHDVIDDTPYTRSDLEAMGYTKRTLDIVDLLSKYRPDGSVDNRPYKVRIASIIASNNEDAIVVKYADMFQNTLPERNAKSGKRSRFEAKYAEPMKELTEAVYMLGYIDQPVVPHQPVKKERVRPEDTASQARQEAQNILVERTIRAALKNLYWQCAQTKKHVNTEITLHDHIMQPGNKYGDTYRVLTIPLYNEAGESCATAGEAWDTIEQLFDNENDRVDAFNALATLNGIDIKLRTTGPKTDESIREKAQRRYRGDTIKVKDVARMMVISRDPLTLEFITGNFDHISKSEDASKEPIHLEDWQMLKMGVVKRTLTTEVQGVPAEVQFVPFEQEEIAGKIVHKIYKIIRSWDAYRDGIDSPDRQEKMKDIAARYNMAAKLINQLFHAEKRGHGAFAHHKDSLDYKQVNRALAEIDEKNEASLRSGSTNKTQPQTYSPIVPVFSNNEELESFRDYLRQGSQLLSVAWKKHILPLPIIPERGECNTVTLEKDLARLDAVRQIAITYYMQQGSPEMRELWRNKAYELNSIAANTIPEECIRSVCHGRNGATRIDYINPTARAQGKAK